MDLTPHPHLSGPHFLEPRICCLRASGEVREAGTGFTCRPKQGSISTPPCLLGPILVLSDKRLGRSSVSCGAPSCCLGLRNTQKRVKTKISCEFREEETGQNQDLKDKWREFYYMYIADGQEKLFAHIFAEKWKLIRRRKAVLCCTELARN